MRREQRDSRYLNTLISPRGDFITLMPQPVRRHQCESTVSTSSTVRSKTGPIRLDARPNIAEAMISPDLEISASSPPTSTLQYADSIEESGSRAARASRPAPSLAAIARQSGHRFISGVDISSDFLLADATMYLIRRRRFSRDSSGACRYADVASCSTPRRNYSLSAFTLNYIDLLQ